MLFRFRWVFCQLDALKECLPKYVRETLKSLPRTLDETYERILRNIHPSRAADAHRVFQYIAFANSYRSSSQSTVRELAEIFAIEFASDMSLPKLVPQYRVSDPTSEISRLCSSLIIIMPNPGSDEMKDDSGCVQFAHFSVQEYMLSDRLSADLQFFHINEQLARVTIVRIYLACFLSQDYCDAALLGSVTTTASTLR